jgi:hypothetical protein
VAISPVTLDKIEPHVIKSIEHKVVNKIVHESNRSESSRDDNNRNNNFNGKQQERAAQHFNQYLLKFKIKLEYKVLKNKVKVRLKDKEGKLLLEIEVDDIEKLFEGVKKETGNIIDLKG